MNIALIGYGEADFHSMVTKGHHFVDMQAYPTYFTRADINKIEQEQSPQGMLQTFLSLF